MKRVVQTVDLISATNEIFGEDGPNMECSSLVARYMVERTCANRGIMKSRKYEEAHPTLRGHAVAQWLRHCATNRKLTDAIPDGGIGIFH
jgi:hypothetical protein